MSKRKRKVRDGEAESSSAQAGKKLKTSHTLSSAGQPTSGDTALAITASSHRDGLVDDNAARKQTRLAKKLAKRLKKQEKKNETNKTLEKVSSPLWKVSEPVGGSLLDLDPIFSPDGQYLLLAYRSYIRVYNISTSLLIRTLHAAAKGTVTSAAFSENDQGQLFLALDSGLIERWNWLDGKRLAQWDLKFPIHRLVTTKMSLAGAAGDVILTADRLGTEWNITAHKIPSERKKGTPGLQTVYTTQHPITSMQALNVGEIIVAATATSLLVGTTSAVETDLLQSISYHWHVIPCPENIAVFDARVSHDKSSSSKKPCLDVAIGTANGVIFVYRDLLRTLSQKEHHKAPTAKRLHWHRQAVGAIKWSEDGNYIISGGLETVLLLWQLDTGKFVSLPHLSSPIESIVVSPGGAAYGIRLADNSTMVISTLDHNPIFNVSGVQVPPPTTTKEAWKGPHASKLHGRRYPAVASRLNPYHILSATPSVVSTRNGPSQSTSKSYLQTIDTRHGTQVAKQALVRTKVTDLSLGPEGNVIDEPNVVLLRGSSDGKWLATVEEWMPPLSDTIDVDFTMEQARLTQKAGFETCLKFWLWNEDTKSWDLSTRFDKPHCSDANVDPSACHILDLLELPSSIGFVTVGVDGKVRVWKPRVRTRNASDVKERAGRALYTWSCRRAVYLPVSEIVSDGICRMAISHDDSLLVTAHQHNDRSITHLVNLNDGEIKMTRCNFFSGKLKGAGVVGRFLVLLADQLNVWNLVDDKLQYAINLRTSHYFARGSPEIYLAIDQIHETFAIAFSTSERVSKVTVFSPAAPALIFDGQAHQDREVVALIPATHQKGYHVIDSSSEITTITPRPVNTIATTEDSEESLQAPSSSRLNITLAPQPLKQSGKESDAGIPLRLHNASHEDDAVHIRQEDISRLLRSEDPLSMPSVATLFERVALYIGGRKESRPSI